MNWKETTRKKCYIRLCDHEWYWDTLSGNSDALCNEDSRDPNCSICDKNMDCKFSNFPFDDNDNYLNIVEYRDKMRNSEVCNKCVYNSEYDWVLLDSQEQRKYKLIEMERKGTET